MAIDGTHTTRNPHEAVAEALDKNMFRDGLKLSFSTKHGPNSVEIRYDIHVLENKTLVGQILKLLEAHPDSLSYTPWKQGEAKKSKGSILGDFSIGVEGQEQVRFGGAYLNDAMEQIERHAGSLPRNLVMAPQTRDRILNIMYDNAFLTVPDPTENWAEREYGAQWVDEPAPAPRIRTDDVQIRFTMPDAPAGLQDVAPDELGRQMADTMRRLVAEQEQAILAANGVPPEVVAPALAPEPPPVEGRREAGMNFMFPPDFNVHFQPETEAVNFAQFGRGRLMPPFGGFIEVVRRDDVPGFSTLYRVRDGGRNVLWEGGVETVRDSPYYEVR